MKKKITILSKHTGENIKMLKKAHAINPYHARVLFLSDSFSNYCKKEKLIKIEYFNDDGSKVNDKFTITKKVIHTMVNSNLELIEKPYDEFNYMLRNGSFKLKLAKTSYNITDLENIEYVNHTDLTLGAMTHNNIEITGHILTVILTNMPWLLFLFEHNLQNKFSLDFIKKNEIYSLKKAFQVIYKGIPFPLAIKIHNTFNDYFYSEKNSFYSTVIGNTPIEKYIQFQLNSNKNNASLIKCDSSENVYLKYNFFDDYSPYLTNLTNFQLSWIYDNNELSKAIAHLVSLAILMDKKVNCAWSIGKMRKYANKWAREYTSIIYAYYNRNLYISNIFYEFEKHSQIHLIKDLKELSFEGHRLNHCIANYVDDIEQGNCAAFTYKNFTFTLSLQTINDLCNYNSFRQKGLVITQFKGYSNCEPLDELHMEVNQKVIAFNRHLLTIPFNEYKDLDLEVIEKEKNYDNEFHINEVPAIGDRIRGHRLIRLEHRQMAEDALNEGNPDLTDEAINEIANDNNQFKDILNILINDEEIPSVSRIIESIRSNVEINNDDLREALNTINMKDNPYWDLILKLDE